MAVELAMIACVKFAVRLNFPASKPLASGTAHHCDLALASLFQKQIVRPLTEHVVDDLNADDARIFERFEALLHLLDTHAMEADLAFALKTVHRLKDFRTIVGFDRRTVQLHEVERIDFKRFEAVLDEWREVRIGKGAASCLGSRRPILVATIGMLFPCFLRSLRNPRDEALRGVVAIDVSGVQEINAII